MTTSRFVKLLAPLAVALAAAPALAHGPGDGGACSGIKGQIESLCAAAPPDTCLSTLCPDVPAGPGQLVQCLLNLNDGKETQKLSTPLTAACVTETSFSPFKSSNRRSVPRARETRCRFSPALDPRCSEAFPRGLSDVE